MLSKSIFRPALLAACAVAVVCYASPVWAAKGARNKQQDAAVKTLDMFSAMATGEIDVKFIPKSSKQATVLIENKGAEPLRVKLPEAFAGVPVLAQIGGMGGNLGPGGGGNAGGLGLAGGGGVEPMWAAVVVCREWGVAWVAWE